VRADRHPIHWWHRLVIAAVLLFLALPVLATLLYSLSTSWGATMLPDGLTLHWYVQLWHEPRFQAVFARSVLLILGSLLVSALVVVPAAFVVVYHFPRLHTLMNIVILMPFTVPPVVSSVGLLQLYSDGPLPMVGTPWVLVGCYFVLVLPFLYRALADRLRAMDLHALMDAAHLLGASTAQAFWHIVLPQLRTALLAALFVSFSTLLSEFVLANLLVGTRFETLQIYLYNVRTESGHYTSAIVMSYFGLTLALTWLALRLSRQR
jgi:putative spermidine/putrescine transport system permease protein